MRVAIFLLSFALFHATASASSRIAGGQVQAPTLAYIVSVQYQGEHVCGGVVMNAKFVITAAQCVKGLSNGKDLTIRQSATHATGGSIRYVKLAHKHPDYKPETKENDIAVLEIAELNVTPSVTLGTDNSVSKYSVFGWGEETVDGEKSPKLQMATVHRYEFAKCQNDLGKLWVKENMLCTTSSEKAGACKGDEGGPLLAADNGRDLYGIYSWNLDCSTGLGVYTNVNKFAPWINSIISPN